MGSLEVASEVEVHFGRFLEGGRSGQREKLTALYLPPWPRPVPGALNEDASQVVPPEAEGWVFLPHTD